MIQKSGKHHINNLEKKHQWTVKLVGENGMKNGVVTASKYLPTKNITKRKKIQLYTGES